MWLRICELINDPLTDPAEALDEILWMNGHMSESYTIAVLTASAAKDLCLATGMRWPEQVLWTGGYLRDASLAEAILGDPVPDIPFPVIQRICGMDVLKGVRYREDFSETFSRCFRAIVARERTSNPDLFGPECFTDRKVLLFDGFAYYGDPEFASARILRTEEDSPWRDIFRGLAATVYSSILWDRDDIPWREALLLSDEQAETVRMVMEERDPEEDGDDALEEWSPGTMEDEGFPLNPTVLEDVRARMVHPRKDTLKASIRTHAGLPGRKDAAFVPSGCWCASYDEMDRAQTDFYLSWRSEVLAGNYRDTDRGYLWLLLCEIIASENEPSRRMSILNGLLRAYGQSSDSIRSLLMRTCQDYAIVTGQDPPWEEGEREPQLILWVKLDEIPVGRIPLDLAEPYMDLDVGSYRLADADYNAAFNIAVRALAAKVYEKTGMSIAEILSGRSKRVNRKLFPGLSSDWGSCSMDIVEIRPTNMGGRILAAAARTALRGINIPMKLKAPKTQSGIDPEYQAAMEAEVEAWVGRRMRARRVEAIRREAAAIVLNSQAVRDAETDLAAVRDLVGTEEEEELTEPATAPEPAAADANAEHSPWELLSGTLDSVQKGYLAASLDGHGDSYARDSGSTGLRLEDGINAAAMDTVGDQIVEDGTVFEEYADDVRRMLAEPVTETA